MTEMAPVKFAACCVCGIPIYGPTVVHKLRGSDGATFYCINGHGQHWDKKTRNLLEELRDMTSERNELKAEMARLKAGQPETNVVKLRV